MSIHKQTDLMKIARREREWIKENHCIHVRALIDKNFYGVALFVVAVADANSMSNGICIIIGKRRRSLWSVVSRKQTPWYRFFERFLKFTSFACKARVWFRLWLLFLIMKRKKIPILIQIEILFSHYPLVTNDVSIREKSWINVCNASNHTSSP